ncbi:MAG: hypothetical protein JJT75_14975 [Opitutales bacterium]|nr:hypothetical protein [Opitutales bacterium]
MKEIILKIISRFRRDGVADAEKGLQDVSRETEQTSRSAATGRGIFGRFFSSIRSGARGAVGEVRKLASGLGGLIGITSLGALARSAMQLADNIDRATMRTDLSAQAWQRWDAAARRSKTSGDQLMRAFEDMGRRVRENEGDFHDIGIATRDANGEFRDNEQIMLDLADAFRDMESPQQRSAAAQRLLGQSGRELVPLLRQGSSGIRDMGDAAEEMGEVMSEKTIKRLAEIRDSLDQLRRRLTVLTGELLSGELGRALGDAIAPTLEADPAQPFIDLRDALRSARTEREADIALANLQREASNLYFFATQAATRGDIERSEVLMERARLLHSLHRVEKDRLDIIAEENQAKDAAKKLAAEEAAEEQKRLQRKEEERERIERVREAERILMEDRERMMLASLPAEEQLAQVRERILALHERIDTKGDVDAAREIVELTQIEANLQEGITQEKERQRESDERAAQRAADALSTEEQQLEVLRLQAAGKEEEARIAERNHRIEAEAHRLAERANISLEEATGRVRERLILEEQIKRNREEQDNADRSPTAGRQQTPGETRRRLRQDDAPRQTGLRRPVTAAPPQTTRADSATPSRSTFEKPARDLASASTQLSQATVTSLQQAVETMSVAISRIKDLAEKSAQLKAQIKNTR